MMFTLINRQPQQSPLWHMLSLVLYIKAFLLVYQHTRRHTHTCGSRWVQGPQGLGLTVGCAVMEHVFHTYSYHINHCFNFIIVPNVSLHLLLFFPSILFFLFVAITIMNVVVERLRPDWSML